MDAALLRTLHSIAGGNGNTFGVPLGIFSPARPTKAKSSVPLPTVQHRSLVMSRLCLIPSISQPSVSFQPSSASDRLLFSHSARGIQICQQSMSLESHQPHLRDDQIAEPIPRQNGQIRVISNLNQMMIFL
jgi:hypothetical protein